MAKRPAVTPAKPATKPARADFENVRVRKIANGHVTTRIGVKDGKFFKQETYSRSKPEVQAAVPKRTVTAARQPAIGEVGFLRARQ